MTKREHMAHLAGVSPATISNWKKNNPKLYKMVETTFNNNIDKKIKELDNTKLLGKYELLVDIAKLETENETALIFDEEQRNRREKLFTLRDRIYGVKNDKINI